MAVLPGFITPVFAIAIGAAGCAPPPSANPAHAPAGPGTLATAGGAIVFPAGTEIPFRFLHGIRAGSDRAGTVVYGQTLGALARDSCVIVEPFLALRGRITESSRGGWLGGRSELTVRFDSVELAPGTFAAFDAVADSLEYVPAKAIGDSGQIYGARARPGRAVGAALAKTGLTAAGLAVVPVAAVEGYLLFRRPAPVRLEAGEVGRLRLLAPLVVRQPAACEHVATNADLATPPLPRFVPRTSNRAGTGEGDPINLIFFGTLDGLDTAFVRAGWDRTHSHGTGAVAHEVEEAIRGRPATVGAPVSTEYFEGRQQDAAYELPGPTARVRHHIRAWRLGDTPGVIVASADEDVGLDINPVRGRATHRVDPDIDRERDYIVVQLEAGSCANLLGVVVLPGAVTEAATATGQRLVTDARTAVVRIRECWRPA